LNALASAVTAGMLLDLTEDQLTEAIAIAAAGNLATLETRAGALSMWKAAAAAYAGRAGLFAALHARAGMTGPTGALDGAQGWLAHVDPEHLDFDDTLGKPRLLRTHLKASPIGYFTQPAVDAALRLRADVDAGRVRAILIETSAFGRLANADGPEKWRPATRETADHSLPYGVAVALLDGEVRERQFRPERIAADDAARLMAMTEVRENAGFTANYPSAVSTRVTITLDDGREVVQQIDHPRGHADNPMTTDEINAKFVDVASTIDDVMLERLWSLPRLDANALRQVLRAVFSAGITGDRAP
jgi:2-methylcitrate dehydratase